LMMFATIGVGFFRYLTGSLGNVIDPPAIETLHNLAPVSLFLILHAFSSGTTALTGVEAISNGITAFKEPRSRNAGITLIWMSAILGFLFLSITFLSGRIGAIPSESETVISQLARTALQGRNIYYLLMISATTVILMMAANTAFADFPRLSALHAGDGFLPRQLTFRGSRLVYSRGIITLAVIASTLIALFQASVTALIPYAIGVFLSFTLSQAGMAKRWWKSGQLGLDEQLKEPGSIVRHDPKWFSKMVVNGFGAVCTAVVAVVFAFTKFRDGAWIVLVITPILVLIFFSIHRHYKTVARKLTLENFGSLRKIRRQRVIVLVSTVHKGTLNALNFALDLSNDVTAVHVSIDPKDAEKVKEKWEKWGNGVRLVIIDSQYRLLIEPILEYIELIASRRQNGEVITVVVPQFVTESPVTGALHENAAFWLRKALVTKPGMVIIEVPYQI